jgi:hypothetical protein
VQPRYDMGARYWAIWQAAYEEILPGDGEMRPSVAHAIAAAVEVGLRRAGFDDDPTRRTMGHCPTQYAHMSHIWWEQPPTKPDDEACWCDGLQIEPPSEHQLVQRYVDAGEPDDSSWGVAAHEWDDRIEREL